MIPRLALPIALAATVLVVGSAPAANDSPKYLTPARLKVSCDQLYEQINTTADQLAVQYTAMGHSIDYKGSFQRCSKQGKRVRQGGGYMVDVKPIPGESDPQISDWYYRWIQVVVRTKKGKLRSTISDFRCDKTLATSGGNYAPGGPC